MFTVIPMAGRGSRFQAAGYEAPKPFIDCQGLPMVEQVIDNLPRGGQTVLIALADHLERTLRLPSVDPEQSAHPRAKVITLAGVTEGAACTVMQAAAYVDSDAELVVANSDQFLDWSPEHFLDYARRSECDGLIATFRASSPKWSYVKADDRGWVQAVAEKVPISDEATCGVYYYRQARLLFSAIDKMIRKNLRVNGEFYLAPAYNEMVLDGAKVLAYRVAEMYGMGTPEDLTKTLASGILREWAR